MEKYILRDEYFGSTLFERRSLTFRFLQDKETAALKNGESIDNVMISSPSEIDLRGGDMKNAPTGVLYSPVRLYFQITKKCNLSCKNCFSPGNGSHELRLDEIMKTLDGLREDNVLEVRITGGEPTRREGWKEIIMHAKDIGLVVSLNTNGVYDSAKVIDDIMDCEPEQIIVSIDGLRDSHDRVRGKSNYDRTRESLKQLSIGGMNLRINTILNDYTLGEILPMAEIAEEHSAEMCFILLRPVGRGMDLLDAIPPIESLNSAMRKIEELRGKHSSKIMTSYDVIRQNAIRPAPDLDLSSCAAGLRGCNINSDGGIYACGFLAPLGDNFLLGNIKDEDYSILNVWRDSEELQDFRKRSLKKTATCRSCKDYEEGCYGSCITMECFKNVNPLGKDPYCLHDA